MSNNTTSASGQGHTGESNGLFAWLTRVSNDRGATFYCPFTGYPDLIWLKGEHKGLVQPHLVAIINDDSIQCVCFSNKPIHLAVEEATGKAPFLVGVGRETKQQLFDFVLQPAMESTSEMVVTNVGGQDISAVLLAFLRSVRQSVEPQV